MKRRSFLKGAAAALAGLWATNPKDLIKAPEPTTVPEQEIKSVASGPSDVDPWDPPSSYDIPESPYFWDGITDWWGKGGPPPGVIPGATVVVWYPDENGDLPFPASQKEIEGTQALDDDEGDHYWSEDDREDE